MHCVGVCSIYRPTVNVRQCVFSSFQSGKAHQVSQFHIVNWNADGRCSNLKTMTDVIEEVTKVQMRTGNNPIVVHCRWGEYCSVFVQPLVAAECCDYQVSVPSRVYKNRQLDKNV